MQKSNHGPFDPRASVLTTTPPFKTTNLHCLLTGFPLRRGYNRDSGQSLRCLCNCHGSYSSCRLGRWCRSCHNNAAATGGSADGLAFASASDSIQCWDDVRAPRHSLKITDTHSLTWLSWTTKVHVPNILNINAVHRKTREKMKKITKHKITIYSSIKQKITVLHNCYPETILCYKFSIQLRHLFHLLTSIFRDILQSLFFHSLSVVTLRLCY